MEQEKGFSLIELIIVLIITAILAQLGFVSFNRYSRRTKAFAAKTALKNIKKECESNSDLNSAEEFTVLPPLGYSYSSGESGDCNSNNGLIVARPNNPDRLPEYQYNFTKKGIVECSKNSSDNFFKNCDSLKNKLEKNAFVHKNTFIESGCSSYVIVDGPSWKEAQANARKIGGNLVIVNDEKESNFIFNAYKTDNESALHIGIEKVNGEFVWQTKNEKGENVQLTSENEEQYSNWAPGEPNGKRDRFNQYGHMYTHTGLWNDHPDSPFPGIAEIQTCD